MVHSVGFVVPQAARYRADQHAATCRVLGHQTFVAVAAQETPAGTIAVTYTPVTDGADAPIPLIEPDVVVLCGPALHSIGAQVIGNARREGQIVVGDIDDEHQTRGAELRACAGVVVASIRLQVLAGNIPRRTWIAVTTIDPAGRPARDIWSTILADLTAGV